MAKQANGVPASARAGGAVVRGRVVAKSPATAVAKPPAATATRSAAPKVRRSRKVKASAPEPEAAPRTGQPALSEEEQIGSAKYLPRELPPRVFEEERFIFPETYGVNRVRLLVKDPHWLFVHWDVDPRVRGGLRREKGERVAALARLTLRLTDDHGGIGGAVMLPEGARSWYLRAVPGHRSYRVELGITLPSGEYRPLARSNAVSTPRVGPSSEKATRRASYRLAAKGAPLTAAADVAPGPPATPRRRAAKSARGTAPEGGPAGAQPVSPSEPAPGSEPGGASDLFRR
ncbi:MAG TPA: DUF4912 domain-containing protein [Vicinamibacteria bacterium]|jgi:hypothetical protein